MDKIKIIKGIANIITGASVGKTVDIALKYILPYKDSLKTSERVAITIGSGIIGAYLSSKCSDYVEGEIDSVVETIDEIKSTVKINKEQNSVVITTETSEEE